MECKYTETDEGYDGTKLHFISEWEGILLSQLLHYDLSSCLVGVHIEIYIKTYGFLPTEMNDNGHIITVRNHISSD